MRSLRVAARVPGQIALPGEPLMLDALLCAAKAVRLGLPPPPPFQRIDIPIELEPGGRFHLCSEAQFRMEHFDLRYVNRRAPVVQYQEFGVRGRVQITAGMDKSYRTPLEVGHLAGGQVEWWCTGEPDEIRDLLAGIVSLGKLRGHGIGVVDGWAVEECEPWPGFPILRDGAPLRQLPRDWPGLAGRAVAYRVLGCVHSAYWDHSREELCAVPERPR